jgi:hypothetical protein
MRTNGSGKVKLCDDECDSIQVLGDWVYYSNKSDDRKIYKIDINGNNRTKISNEAGYCFEVVGDWIYNGNHKIRTDGNEKTKLSGEDDYNHMGLFYVMDGIGHYIDQWLYYTDFDGKLHKCRLDKSETSKLSDEEILYFNISDGWIYFYNGDYKICKMRMDGSGESTLVDLYEESKSDCDGICVIGDRLFWIDRYNYYQHDGCVFSFKSIFIR